MESLLNLTSEPVAALEKATIALTRLEVLVESNGSAIADAFPVRQAVAMQGSGHEGVVALLMNEPSARFKPLRDLYAALSALVAPTLSPASLVETLRSAGVALPDPSLGILRDATSPDLHLSEITRAAAAYGAIVSSAPATRETLRTAALASDILLAAGGIATRSRVSPLQLDAATRAAAVQIERSAAWSEWIRAWSMHLAREAASAERAVRALVARRAKEVTAARSQRRVGATDTQVLAHLHGVSTFIIPDAAPALVLSAPTVGTSIERLEASGVATELTGQKRDRIWVATALLDFMVGR